ncbi:cytochrome P450 81Q32-like [Silene latifolia]|uniref:cytochrome P450 81Q32-like n=1 Tax=Silene latifolia TaxID=37657 RepID=UPI003D77B9F3
MDFITILYYVIILIISYTLTKTLLLHKLRNLPPTPFPTLPIIGHLHLLKSSDSNPIHRALSQISSRYGPIVFLQLGSRPTLLVSSASAAEDCLHHNDVIFANRPRLIGNKILAYESTTMLWAPYGPLWRTHRRIASTEILSPHRINLLAHIRADEVVQLVKGIFVKGRDQAVDMKTVLVELTNNVMMRTIAGKRIHGEEEGSEFSTRFKMILNELVTSGGAFTMVDFLPWLKWVGVEKMAERKWMKIFVKLDKFLQDLVEETRKGLEKEGGSEGQNRNLIQVLLELKKTNPDYATDTIIKGLVEILLLAGTETSASTMEWALALLIKNPHVHQKAKEEIDAYVGYDRLIEESDLAHIPYIHYIINETLRMYPVTPILLPHESTDDCVVGGYKIPKGTMLQVNIWAIHNDPKVWDEPLVFKPERFEGVTGDRIGYKFMPFGSGRRACPGEHLATRLIGLTLASVIQCFEFEAQEVDMKEGVGLSMRKKNSLKATFRPRKELAHLLTQM